MGLYVKDGKLISKDGKPFFCNHDCGLCPSLIIIKVKVKDEDNAYWCTNNDDKPDDITIALENYFDPEGVPAGVGGFWGPDPCIWFGTFENGGSTSPNYAYVKGGPPEWTLGVVFEVSGSDDCPDSATQGSGIVLTWTMADAGECCCPPLHTAGWTASWEGNPELIDLHGA